MALSFIGSLSTLELIRSNPNQTPKSEHQAQNYERINPELLACAAFELRAQDQLKGGEVIWH